MGEQKKSSKIGRNKKKCEAYRYSHGNVSGSKKPKGIGNFSLRRDRNSYPFVMDSQYEGREHRPKSTLPHLCTEIMETHCNGNGRADGLEREMVDELARHIRPYMRGLVVFIPKKKVT